MSLLKFGGMTTLFRACHFSWASIYPCFNGGLLSWFQVLSFFSMSGIENPRERKKFIKINNPLFLPSSIPERILRIVGGKCESFRLLIFIFSSLLFCISITLFGFI